MNPPGAGDEGAVKPDEFWQDTRSFPICHFETMRVFLLVVFLLAGCATDPDRNEFVRSRPEKRIKVLLAEAPMKISPSRLRSTLDLPEKEDIAPEVMHAQSHAMDRMIAMLKKQRFFSMLAEPYNGNEILQEDGAIGQQDADAIHRETGADAILRFRITDYGLTPGSWRDGYIAFEVGSTLAIAGAIAYAGSTAAHAAAGGYLAQEAVEETTEAYAGFSALDIVCRPVRLEAELIRLKPVGRIWEADETGLSDIRLSRLTGTVSDSERNFQLDQSTNHAARDISEDLAKAFGD